MSHAHDVLSGSLTTGEDDSSSQAESERPRKVRRKVLSHVHAVGPAFPLSVFEGLCPEIPPVTESEAIRDLSQALQAYETSIGEPLQYRCFKLDNFSIYQPQNPRHAYELCSLDRLQNRDGHKEFLFDGTLSVDGEQRFVQGVRFRTMAIEGYGDLDITDMHDRISLQSPHAARTDVWYQLGTPSKE